MTKSLKLFIYGKVLVRLNQLTEKIGLRKGSDIQTIKHALQVFEFLVDEYNAGTKFFTKSPDDLEPKPVHIFTEKARPQSKVVSILPFLKGRS